MATKHAAPPDGGYGWVVVVASFIAHFIQYGIVWTVGILYVVFLENMEASKPAIALISSLNTAAYLGTGPLAGMLTNRYGHRAVAMAGGLVSGVGMFLSSFSENVTHLYLSFGILCGFGLGLAYIPSITIVGMYFEKKRSIAFGLAVSGVGLGTFAFPPIIRFFVDYYGWRGALTMMAGICMNICVCGALMRPIPVAAPPSKVKDTADQDGEKKTWWRKVANAISILNLPIFKNTRYLFLCLNNALFCMGHFIVYVHLSAYAETIGFTENQGAWLFSIVGISNFVGRIAFGLLAHIPGVNATVLYVAALSAGGVITHFVPLTMSHPLLMTYAGAFGALSAAFGVLLPQVIVKILDIELMASGYGYILVFEAIGTLVGPPAAGWIYDATGMYASSFYLGGSFMILSGITMAASFCMKQSITVEESEVYSQDSSVEMGENSVETGQMCFTLTDAEDAGRDHPEHHLKESTDGPVELHI